MISPLDRRVRLPALPRLRTGRAARPAGAAATRACGARRRLSCRLLRSVSRGGHAIRRPWTPSRPADRQLARRAERVAGRGKIGWLDAARRSIRRRSPARRCARTYAIVREALEASIATRVCRDELWTVSQFVNGWQVQDGYIVTIQPVGTDEARSDALARWSRAAALYRHRNRQPARGHRTAATPRRRATFASSSIR